MRRILISFSLLLASLLASSASAASLAPKHIFAGGNTLPDDNTLTSDTTALDTAVWSKDLDAVTVVAKKPLVKTDIDKLSYDVESDPESKTNNILEMLRKVPMVTVDGQDNIKVNNSSSFKVYVNGKPNNMMSNNPSEVLKSMPANTIKKIEVITNPGPKYDAEGVGGILNIITVGRGMEGYTLTVGSNVNTNGGVGGNLFGTVQKGKLTVSGRYNYNHRKQPRSWSRNTQEVLGETGSSSVDDARTSSANVVSESSTTARSNFQSGSLEASYEIDTLRLVTASFGLWGANGKGDIDGTGLGTYPKDGSQLYRYADFMKTKQSWYSIDGSIDYQRSFHKKDRLLTFSYKINTEPNTRDDNDVYSDMEAVDAWQDYLHRLKNQRHKQDASTTEQTFQIDYTTPIGKLHTLEAGAKYILRNNKSNDDRYTQDAQNGQSGQATDGYAYDEENSSHYKHTNDILAGYLGYGLKWNWLSGRLGLRYEHTLQDVKYLLGRGDNFRKNFDDLVPSASVGFRVTDEVNFRLGYNMRIYRPGIWFLNPYLDDSNPASISQGNSDLVSEKNHRFSLGFNLNTSKFSLNMNAIASFTNNSIESVTSLVNDRTIVGLQNPTGKDVLYTTYQNIGKKKIGGVSAYVSWNVFKNTRIYSNLYGCYCDYSDGMSLRNHGWYGYTSSGLDQTLPKDWRVTLNYFGMTPDIVLQGKGSSYSSYSMSVNKSFFDKRLTFALSASNFFRKYRESEDVTESTNFRQTSWGKYRSSMISFSVSYRLGSLKASVKKAERTIENDDVKGGGNGGN